MYEIKLPENGCSVYYGTYIDNYYNSIRTRYYLNDGQLVRSSTASYSRLPDGAVCLSQGDLIYKPELEVYFNLFSILCAGLIFWFAYRLIIHPFWRKIR